MPIGGSVELPQEGSTSSSSEACAGLEIPPGVLTLNKSGDVLTLVSDLPEFESSNGTCVTWNYGRKTTFEGTLVEPATSQTDADSSDASGSQGTPSQGTGDDQASDDSGGSDGSGGSAPAIIGGVLVCAVAAAATALVLRRRQHRASPQQAGGASQPQVRPKSDRGTQTIAPTGPSTGLGLRAVADGTPTIAIAMITSPTMTTGDGPTHPRS